MLLPLLLLLAAPAESPAAATALRSDDPPVKVWLDQDNYRRGDKAHVNVQLGEDGYLVVLRADADRRVRVLFPLDPGDDAFVRGGRAIELRGRGDREAVNYTAASPLAYYGGAYYPYSSSVGLGLGYGFGGPRSFSFSLAVGEPFFFRPFFFRARCFDPFFFDPFFCDP